MYGYSTGRHSTSYAQLGLVPTNTREASVVRVAQGGIARERDPKTPDTPTAGTTFIRVPGSKQYSVSRVGRQFVTVPGLGLKIRDTTRDALRKS